MKRNKGGCASSTFAVGVGDDDKWREEMETKKVRQWMDREDNSLVGVMNGLREYPEVYRAF